MTPTIENSRPIRIALVVLILLFVFFASGQDADLSWRSIDGGGGISAAGEIQVAGTVGQHDATAVRGVDTDCAGGFWPGTSLCLTDTNGDGDTDVSDLLDVILDWGCVNPPGPCVGDVDHDGSVDVADLVDVIVAWGPCLP